MDINIDALNPAWIGIIVTLIAGAAPFILSDKKIRAENANRVYELQTISFNFLVFIFTSFYLAPNHVQGIMGSIKEFDKFKSDIRQKAVSLGFF